MSYEVDADALLGDGGEGSDSGSCRSPVGIASPEDALSNPYADGDDDGGGPSFPEAESTTDSATPVPSGLSFGSFQSFNSFRGNSHRGGGRGDRHGGRGGLSGGYSHGHFGDGGGRGYGRRSPRSGPAQSNQHHARYGGGSGRGRGAGHEYDPNIPVIHARGAPVPSSRTTSLHFDAEPNRGTGAGNSSLPSSKAPPFGRQGPPQTRGPFIHPDRKPPMRMKTVSAPDSKQSIASILPEDGLRDRIIAENAEKKQLANEGVRRRKRPGGVVAPRKRPRVFGADDDDDSLGPMATGAANPKVPAAKFGSLLSLASGSGVSGLKRAGPRGAVSKARSARSELPPVGRALGEAVGRSRGAPASGTRPSTAKVRTSVYAQATTTKESLEREAEEQRQEEARVEEAFRERRRAERHTRRVVAGEMRKMPTVSSTMRDAHMLDRVERHLFNDEQGKTVRDTLGHVGLTRKEVEADPMSEKLWTIVIEEF